MIAFIDGLLNRITMYRLMLYFLIVLLAVAAVFGAIGILPYSPLAIAFSSFFLIFVCWTTNGIFAKAFDAQANVESHYITALILALIITPVSPVGEGSLTGIFFLLWAGVFAMASKYILAAKKKHIFNPAAFAVALTSFTIGQSASWWVGGNLPLLGFVLIGGLLIVRKIRRFDLVLSFLSAALISFLLMSRVLDPDETIKRAILHTTLLFFASVMLTEPLTTPPTRPLRIFYGILVGFIFPPAVHIGYISSTPELALLVGNIYSYVVSPKEKFVLKLREKKEVGAGMYDFAFALTRRMKFSPGQYMEWTLGHEKADLRGNRRYFTIASSPTEDELHLGVRFYEPPSTFKRKLLALQPGDTIVGGQLAGDFTLPHDPSKKLAFLAGGIGITPFRSMAKYLIDKNEARDIVLLYSNKTPREIAYRELFDAAARVGWRTVHAITDAEPVSEMTAGEAQKNLHFGRIDAAFIAQEVPDYADRTFYISGPHAMVTAFETTLHGMGVPVTRIKIDFFPGFA